ncbi:MAG TPA: CAP domain-containing protein [Alphaproteobacteria bacterium]|jgi:uncharacterized protein YkwD
MIFRRFTVPPRGLFRALLVASCIAAPFTGAGAATSPGSMADDMIAAVNAARATEGLVPLTAEPRLAEAACRQARDLAGKGLYAVADLNHQGSDGSDLSRRLADAGYRFRTAAENLAAGVADPQETVQLWMASDGHRRNILTEAFREAGVAHVGPHLSPAGNRSGPTDVWVLVLAAPGAGLADPAEQAQNPKDCAAPSE